LSAAPRQVAEVPQTDASRNARLEPPLVVDLDGTLVSTDLLIEAILALIERAPCEALLSPLWLLRGRAAAKRELASRVRPDIESLPYRQELCAYLREEARRGRRLVLATANDESFASEIARHLGFFERVIASDGVTNLKGPAKRERLVGEFGERGFDYVGDARSDFPVWSSARNAVVVGGARLSAAVAQLTTVQRVIAERTSSRVPPLFRALRTQHWLKNLLVFVPLLAAHRWNEPAVVGRALLAFASLCLIASGLYVCNDLFDLSADRHHPRKKLRPIPAGELPLGHAVAAVPVLLAVGFSIALCLPWGFFGAAAAYLVVALAYSLRLKRVVLLDVMLLTSLYLLRIGAGGAAVATPVSRWLLALSMFGFLSLALLKRHTEIVTMRVVTGGAGHLRGYRVADSTPLMTMGIASGYVGALVVALYADSAAAARFYSRPAILWLVCPMLVYWISYLWLMTERGRMEFDPVVFSVKDRTSQVLIAIMLGLSVLAI